MIRTFFYAFKNNAAGFYKCDIDMGKYTCYDSNRKNVTCDISEMIMTDHINICLLFKHIWEREERYANTKLNSFELTFTQSNALEYIVQNAGGATQKSLEEHMQIQHSAVVGIVSRLESKGMIASAYSPKDQRQKLLFPTNKGLQVLESIQSDKKLVADKLLDGFSEKDIVELQSLLERVSENLDRE